MRHSGERPYKCIYCDYSSIQSDAYKNHILNKHSNKIGSNANVFLCSECPFKTVKAESYLNHNKEKHSKGKRLLQKSIIMIYNIIIDVTIIKA